jgi:hypothetical protein
MAHIGSDFPEKNGLAAISGKNEYAVYNRSCRRRQKLAAFLAYAAFQWFCEQNWLESL